MGWIKLWRELIKKPIWKKSSPEHCKILITILVMVNYEENEWEWEGKKFMIQPGQMITSLESIRKKADKGISTRNVRSALERFQNLGFLTSKTTNQGRLITVLNWDTYQGDDREADNQDDKRPTSDRQTTDKRPTSEASPIKEVKKVKKDKKVKKGIIYCQSQFDEFMSEYPECTKSGRTKGTPTLKKWKANLKAGVDPEDMIRGARNYAATIVTIKDRSFVIGAQRFLGPDETWRDYQEARKAAKNYDDVSPEFESSKAAALAFIEDGE